MPRHKLPPKNFKWSAELAYLIGLLATDGNLSKDGRHITMRSSDLQLLITFKKCLHLTNKIARSKNNNLARKPSYRIQFGNVQLYRWLLTIGLFPNKTYTIGSLKIPDIYFNDSIKLLHWIYYKNKLPCLNRKRRISDKTLKIISHHKRKKYTKHIIAN